MNSLAKEQLDAFLKDLTAEDVTPYLIAREWLEEQPEGLFGNIPNDQICFTLRWLAQFQRCPVEKMRNVSLKRRLPTTRSIRDQVEQTFPDLSEAAIRAEVQSRLDQLRNQPLETTKKIYYCFLSKEGVKTPEKLYAQPSHVLPCLTSTFVGYYSRQSRSDLILVAAIKALAPFYHFALKDK